MSQHTPGAQRTAGGHRSGGGGVAGGGTFFAAVLLSLAGLLGILQGITAIANDDVYARVGDYVFEFDLTAWGWIHLVLGVLVVLTGAGLFKGANWARAGGITLAGLSAVANFLWLPYQPWWALTLLAIDVFIIWALCASWSHTTD
ncbi:hypothetical protein AB0B30_02755 [Streptomyces narbonensis]|uniref:DUF7144 domain-containing protein n=1 Tax=Streptomyces narbonensis TaxID=67333 RepID=A0ABV3C1I3_9ACTN